MKILIVKTSALGDIVHALLAAVYLKKVNPEAQIHWLVEEAFTEILEPLPYIERVIPLNMRKLRKEKSLAEIRKLREAIRFIRGMKYDLVLDLQGNSKSGFFTLMSGGALRFGFDRNGVREWPNLLSTNRKITLTAKDHHISDRSLAIAREAVPGDNISVPEISLQACEESQLRVTKWLAENNSDKKKIVVCHTGTTWVTKLWPQDNWCELLRWMIEKGSFLPVLTWGNETERSTAQSIMRASGGSILLWSGGSLGDLTALLFSADLVLGSDTGPVHMAAALGTPTVSFYRVTDSSRNGPRGSKHVCLQAPLDCSPCLLKECPRDDECGHSIHLKEALNAIERLLK